MVDLHLPQSFKVANLRQDCHTATGPSCRGFLGVYSNCEGSQEACLTGRVAAHSTFQTNAMDHDSSLQDEMALKPRSVEHVLCLLGIRDSKQDMVYGPNVMAHLVLEVYPASSHLARMLLRALEELHHSFVAAFKLFFCPWLCKGSPKANPTKIVTILK